MKILVITQKADRKDPILGFFTSWLEELSKKFRHVTLICLEKGEYSPPINVKVLSLGKESGGGRHKYLFNFYKYIWQERNNYDIVFVHMNQIYIVLGAILWKFLNKKVILWRNHPKGNILTNLAACLSDLVFCTSPSSYTSRFKKTVLMPAGIDTDLFKPEFETEPTPRSILYVGRISPIKNVDILIDALNIMHSNNIEFKATIVGGPDQIDGKYYNKIIASSESIKNSGKISFLGSVPNFKMPEIYNKHKILINLTPSGSMDKTILEAMACNVAPLVINSYLKQDLSEEFVLEELNGERLAKKLEFLLVDNKAHDFRDIVVKKHSLSSLADKIYQYAK